MNLLERNPAFPGNLLVCFLCWIGRRQNRMEFCSCWTAESRLVLPTLRKQKQRNAVEKRGAELHGISAAAHLMDRDDSGCLAHESSQRLLVVLLRKIPRKTWTMTVVAFFFFFFFLNLSQPAPSWFRSKHRVCVQQLFSHLYHHARRRRWLLLSVAAKNTQALSVCLNPSRKKRRGSCQRRPLLLHFTQLLSLCHRLASAFSSHQKPDAESSVFKSASGDLSLSWCR